MPSQVKSGGNATAAAEAAASAIGTATADAFASAAAKTTVQGILHQDALSQAFLAFLLLHGGTATCASHLRSTKCL